MESGEKTLTVDLASLEGVKVELNDNRPILLVTAGAVTLKLVAGGDPDADYAGLRRLRDGIGKLQQEVLGLKVRAEQEATARKVAAEAAVVDDDWAPDERIAEAQRRITRREPAIHFPPGNSGSN